MADLTAGQIRSLESIRQQLVSLKAALQTFGGDISNNQPLPSRSSIQSHIQSASGTIKYINSVLADNQETFSSTFVFPLPSYRAENPDAVLDNLLRTKPDPQTEDWIRAEERFSHNRRSHTDGLSDAEQQELWQWAPQAAQEVAKQQYWGGDYTLEEVNAGVKNVITGLRRQLIDPKEDEEGDEEDEDIGDDEEDDENVNDSMDVDDDTGTTAINSAAPTATSDPNQQAMPLEALHRFMMSGVVK